MNFKQQWNRKSRSSVRTICVKPGCERFCTPIKSKSKISKKRTCRLFPKNSSCWEEKFYWHWRTKKIFFPRIWSIAESSVSSSSFTTCALSLQTSSVFTEQSRRYVKSMNPFTRERGDPLWEGNRVHHSCQAWARQKCLWIVMTLLAKIFYCNNMENELKSYHNKTN